MKKFKNSNADNVAVDRGHAGNIPAVGKLDDDIIDLIFMFADPGDQFFGISASFPENAAGGKFSGMFSLDPEVLHTGGQIVHAGEIALKQELHGKFPAHAFEMKHGYQAGMVFFFSRRILIVIYIKLLVHDQETNQPFREKFLSRLAISTAVRAASAPRLPALVPLRSMACSMFSVETTP